MRLQSRSRFWLGLQLSEHWLWFTYTADTLEVVAGGPQWLPAHLGLSTGCLNVLMTQFQPSPIASDPNEITMEYAVSSVTWPSKLHIVTFTIFYWFQRTMLTLHVDRGLLKDMCTRRRGSLILETGYFAHIGSLRYLTYPLMSWW